jgi:hypothetical protein
MGKGETRATQDLDLVVKIPIKTIHLLSKELEKRDVLVPAEIIFATTALRPSKDRCRMRRKDLFHVQLFCQASQQFPRLNC